MQFNYSVFYKQLTALSAEKVLKEEEETFSGADPSENRKAAFDFFQQKLKENSVIEPALVNTANHSSKAIVVELKIYDTDELLHNVTLYQSSATERDLLEPAQKELGFYKQYGINLPEESVNNTLLLIVPRFSTQVVQ